MRTNKINTIMSNNNTASNCTVRKFIAITLSHAERREVSLQDVISRIKGIFKCTAIVVANEEHQGEGFHYHVAVKNEDASKYTAIKKIREAFSEFEGKQCNVKFNKGIQMVLGYITKKDKKPTVWGEYSLEQVLQMGENARRHKRNERVEPAVIMEGLQNCPEWYQVYDSPMLRDRLLKAYANMRKIHEDYQVIINIKRTVGEKVIEYLQKKEWPEEYSPEEIREKYILIDWLACQLCFERPIKTRQLFIYGEPSTQKTLIIHYLAKALRIYFASAIKNDFSGADDYYDVWVFDEFHEPDEQNVYGITSATEAGTAYANTLLKVLDGQECRLDAKYGKIFNKRANVPIIMIANMLPERVKRRGPFQERFLRLRFSNNIEELEEERVIATLWGCIRRRIFRNIDWQKRKEIKPDIKIKYNQATAKGIVKRQRKQAIFYYHHFLTHLLKREFKFRN